MSFSDKTAAFKNWLVKSSIQLSPKIDIADLRDVGEGRAVVAIEDIEEDEVLFSIPRSALINANSCSLIQDHESLREVLNGLDQWQALLLAVLYEWKVKGKDSLWFPYLEVLPINDTENYQFNQLMYWSEAELAKLQPSYIVNRVGARQAEEMFSKLKELYLKYLGEVSQDDFNAVATLIMSYSFDVSLRGEEKDDDDEQDDEDEEEEPNDSSPIEQCSYLKSMVPFADTLNADTHGHNASLMYSADLLSMRSIKRIPKGEQVYNSYSQHPNAELLRRYGYVELSGSAHDFAEISQVHLRRFFDAETKIFDTAIQSLKNIEEEQDESFVLETYDCFAAGEVIFELIFIIQILDVILKVNLRNGFLLKSELDRYRSVRRIFKKCYQLLEAKKLTKGFLEAYKAILQSRMSEYPNDIDINVSGMQKKLSRSDQAQIVLKSEWLSLKNCLNIEEVFLSGDEKFTVIDDEKLLKNILKDDSAVDKASHSRKKQKRV